VFLVCVQFTAGGAVPLLESKIEGKVVLWWKSQGNLTLKLNVLGNAGWPDRVYFLPGGRILFIEFKREGTKPYPRQEYIHRKLAKAGHLVKVCRSFEEAKAALEQARASASDETRLGS
jgi:hypothetical protein